jgi:hypothetical protein
MNYNIDDYGIMRVYDGNRIVAEISDCADMDDERAEWLATEVYEERSEK